METHTWAGICGEELEGIYCELEPGHEGPHIATINLDMENIEQVIWE